MKENEKRATEDGPQQLTKSERKSEKTTGIEEFLDISTYKEFYDNCEENN